LLTLPKTRPGGRHQIGTVGGFMSEWWAASNRNARAECVGIYTMAAAGAPPHLELLGYHGQNSQRRQLRPHDLAADRLVFDTGDAALRLLQDPDGHFILFDGRT
jgi:hypothetical protein